MAEPGVSPQATLLPVTGYDPFRLYYDVPVWGGWRELRDPLTQRRYWNNVNSMLMTWSLVELLRLNGLEEFLLLGDWQLFSVVPEKMEEYEDPYFHLPVFETPELVGTPLLDLKPGDVVVSIHMPKKGISEILLPDKEAIIKLGYTKYRWPPQDGSRYLQHLPARMRNDDFQGMDAVVVPTWTVLPAPSNRVGPNGTALCVTQSRDPRSQVIGWLHADAQIRLHLIEGTRALLGYLEEEDAHLAGGWISVVRLDGCSTIRRILEETENQRIQRELTQHLKELEAAGMDTLEALKAIDEAQDILLCESASVSSKHSSHRISSKLGSKLSSRMGSKMGSRRSSADRTSKNTSQHHTPRSLAWPKVADQFVGPPEKQEQRETVIGGWRQVMDPVWNRPLYVAPVQGRSTWGVNEVIKTGGLDDLLLNRSWELCCIDPEALEIQKADDWFLNVYSTPSLTGEAIAHWEKGRLIIVQMFEAQTGVATVLIPPMKIEDDAATGYVSYAMRDGRPLLKAMVAPIEEWPELPEGQLFAGAKPPEGEFLEGPFFNVLPLEQSELIVSIGQDVGSDDWAKMPRGYRLRQFAEILGFRARLPDLEGGGWVSLCNQKGMPHFRKQPSQAPELDLPDEVSSRGSKSSKLSSAAAHRKKGPLPIVWPGLGIWIPDVPPKPVPKPEPKTLPELLYAMGTGRALCDWQRMALEPYKEMVWKNRHAPSTTRLHDLLRLRIWKPAVVETEWLHLREAEDERSRRIASMPQGSCVITQWVSSTGSVRLLLPEEEEDPSPGIGWADLGGAEGACVVLLEEGLDFWVEPQGGHIADEDQEDVDQFRPTLLAVRESWEADSPKVGMLQRGDVVQVAEISGRYCRVVRTKSIEEIEDPVGGWIDLFSEAGWSCLRKKFLGQSHPEEVKRRILKESFESVLVQLTKESENASSSKKEAEIFEEEEAELPELLRELGELEAKSLYTRDWREAIDPVWGRRYFINRWSGQVIHKLTRYGVAEAAVKLTVYFNNLSVNAAGLHREEWPEKKLQQLEDSAIPGFAAMADVPEKRVAVKFLAGPEDPVEQSLPPTPSDSEDSITGEKTYRPPRSDLKVEVMMKAPGVKASWASAGLQKLMSDAEIFTNYMAEVLGSVPQIWLLQLKDGEPFTMVRADLEEMDIARDSDIVERAKSKASEMEEMAALVDSEFVELRKNLMWSRPKSMQYAFHQIGEVNARAMCEGLEMAYQADHVKDPSHLEELSIWGCGIGNGGAVALANAFAMGCGEKLQTIILDENDIGAAGAKALGAGLQNCPFLQELSLPKNPLGKGFTSLLEGLGPSLKVFDAAEAQLDDEAAVATAKTITRWPRLRSLRLAGNVMSLLGIEALVRSMLLAKDLQQLDLRGSSTTPLAVEWHRLMKLLEKGKIDTRKLRL